MTPDERKTIIEAYHNSYQQLVSALTGFPREMWQFRPSPDRWTIHEIVVHITDSEVNSYVRCRRLLAEPGSTVLGYDENIWAQNLHYHQQSVDDALALFRLLRLASYQLIQEVQEPAWENRVYHSENGWMTLEDWLDTYSRHVQDHIAQMQLVFEDWISQADHP
jgi:hypothetical protein